MRDEGGREKTLEMLEVARRLADHAAELGVVHAKRRISGHGEHLGCVMADTILQAGVSYRAVVWPRIVRIRKRYPNATRLSGVKEAIAQDGVEGFLCWTDGRKVERFLALTACLEENGVDGVAELRIRCTSSCFCEQVLGLHGFGRKTIDYMSCLAGVDGFAVDRHAVRFARECGVAVRDYEALHRVFCYAADLLGVARSDFDGWIWARGADRRGDGWL